MTSFEYNCLSTPLTALVFVPDVAESEVETMKIDEETMKKWQAPYRGWHYYPDHVVPAKRGIKGFEGVVSTGVPTVFQLPGGWSFTAESIE